VEVDLAQGLDVVDQLVVGSRQRLVLQQPPLGSPPALHHLHLPGGRLLRRDGSSRSTVSWGVGGGRSASSPARRPVASFQLAVCGSPSAAGTTSRHNGSRKECFDLVNALRANVEDHNRDAAGTTPTSRWLTPRAPSDRIDTVRMPRGSKKVLWNTVPRGTMKAKVSPAAPPNVVLITLVQLPVYWDRP